MRSFVRTFAALFAALSAVVAFAQCSIALNSNKYFISPAYVHVWKTYRTNFTCSRCCCALTVLLATQPPHCSGRICTQKPLLCVVGVFVHRSRDRVIGRDWRTNRTRVHKHACYANASACREHLNAICVGGGAVQQLPRNASSDAATAILDASASNNALFDFCSQ